MHETEPHDQDRYRNNHTSMNRLVPPPRLLLGCALLFWGAMTEKPLLGLILALVVEGANWIRLRWDFNDSGLVRAWQLCALAIAATTALIWLEGDRYTALPQLLTWMPLLLLPMQFVQSYGLRDSIPLGTFSLFARLRRERNRRLGLQELPVNFNFGNAYFVVILIGATVGRQSENVVFLPGVLVLLGWLLLAGRRAHPALLVATLLAAGGFAIFGQHSLNSLYDYLVKRSGGNRDYSSFDPNFSRTAIGSLGEIKQSPNIVWRITTEPKVLPPRLLRTASYQRYQNRSWINPVPEGVESHDDDFVGVPSFEFVGRGVFHLLGDPADQESTSPVLPRFTLRGAGSENTPLPLPGNAASLTHLDDAVQKNSFGTVRISPKEGVLSGTVLWNHSANPETSPSDQWRSGDLLVQSIEEEGVATALEQLELDRQPTLQKKLEVLRRWFAAEFTYTRYLTAPPFGEGSPSPVSHFLLNDRKGHCEYFATAAALMLRQAGIPTRYAVGFAVVERNEGRGEWVVRGTHGHAWTRVWDAEAGVWIDFDPTPPDWLAIEPDRTDSLQWLKDWFQRTREDFTLWRTQPDNRLLVSSLMFGIGTLGLIFIVRRLWHSRRTIETVRAGVPPVGSPARTPLHELEKDARRILGKRREGQPYALWMSGLRSSIANPATLDEALKLHQRMRFDPATAATPPTGRLAELASALRASLQTLKPPKP
jgi:hypothetical protein